MSKRFSSFYKKYLNYKWYWFFINKFLLVFHIDSSFACAFILCLIFTVCLSSDQINRCPSNLVRTHYLKTLGETCYLFNVNKLDWNGAEQNCKSKGGSLATIRTQKIQQFLMDSLRTLGWETDPEYVWMGAHDRYREDHWQWIDGNLD